MKNANKIPATVVQQKGSIEITFSDDIPKELIEKQVEECQSGTCGCCTPVFRSNVKSFLITHMTKPWSSGDQPPVG